MHVKRTNLVLNEELLKTATRMMGVKTYSEAVNRALAEMVRKLKVNQLHEFVGSGIWSGELGEMRADDTSKSKKSRK
jgi:Arc/MetJ family transcription regulator